MTCKHCGHTETQTTKQFFKNNAEHLRVECAACYRFIGYKPKATTLELAAKFTMPYGKYQGMRLDQLAARDMSYLEWLATECKTLKIRKYAVLVLGNASTLTEDAKTHESTTEA